MTNFWAIQSDDNYSFVAKKGESGDIVVKHKDVDGEVASIHFTKEEFEAMLVAYQVSNEACSQDSRPDELTKVESSVDIAEPNFIDISVLSIDEIESKIQDWVVNLKEGDDVFVMCSPLGWRVSEYSFAAKTIKVTDCRVHIDADDPKFRQFHRKSGLQVKGVDAVGDFRLLPPWLNQKDLEDAWAAMEFIRRMATLKRIPTSKLLSILEEIED